MSAVTYRDATRADAALLADLFTRTFTETFGHLYDPRDLASFLDGVTAQAYAAELANPEFDIRIALATDEPVGFAKLGPPNLPGEPPPNTLELWQIYVLKTRQGSGIGPVLYDWAVERARERGAAHLQLSVYVDNHRARAFYARRGFGEIGPYAFMVGSHADEDIVMRCRL